MLVASFIVYSTVFIAPGDPVTFLTGRQQVSEQTKEVLRKQYNLDQPFLSRYVTWLGDAASGDFGRSIRFRQDVGPLVSARIPTTAVLVSLALVMILVGGLALGSIAAVRAGPIDTSILVAMTISLSTPAFVTAILLTQVFAVDLGWFPVFGSGDGFADKLYHLTLPAIALAVSLMAIVARISRAAVREELGREHVYTAVGRGLNRGQVFRRHVFRNALIPVVTLGGLVVATLLSTSVVVEKVFELDGLGSLLIDSVETKDFAIVQAVTLLFVATFVVLNTVIDLLYGLIDPRVSMGARRGK